MCAVWVVSVEIDVSVAFVTIPCHILLIRTVKVYTCQFTSLFRIFWFHYFFYAFVTTCGQVKLYVIVYLLHKLQNALKHVLESNFLFVLLIVVAMFVATSTTETFSLFSLN